MSHGAGRLSKALDHQYAAALSVCSGALVALVWSALSSTNYRRVITTSWWPGRQLNTHSVILNGAMTIFFAAVGLELSRELRSNLRHHLRASLSPLLGALGGMAGTASLSLLIGAIVNSSALRRGWGIPMATDIAFTLGVLALAGHRIPPALRVFLLTLAIADDVLSVVVLSITGVAHVRGLGLIAIVGVTAIGVQLGRRVSPRVAFPLILVVLWLAFAWAGIETALSGVVAGLVIPVTSTRARQLEVLATRYSVAVALPLFALVACGVTWTSLTWSSANIKVISGTIVVRLLGKLLGIGAGVYVATKLGAPRHASLTPRILTGATLLCAIGFTVPLLFAGALFDNAGATYGSFTLGLLGASLLGALGGVVILRQATK